MKKDGMTPMTMDKGGFSATMKAKKISTGNRSFTRRKAVPKRSMGFSFKK